MKYFSIFKLGFVIFCFISFLLSGCTGAKSLIQDAWILSNINKHEKYSMEEIVEKEARNCCGYTGSKEVSCDISKTNTFGMTTGVEHFVEAAIIDELGITFSSGENLELPLPEPGYINRYSIIKTYSIISGEAIISSNQGETKTYPFNYQVDCSQRIEENNVIRIPCGEVCDSSPENEEPTEEFLINPTVNYEPSNSTIDAPSDPNTNNGPFRDQYLSSIGSGLFSNVYYSDGNADFSQTILNSDYYRITRIRREENPDGCGTAQYFSNYIWFSGSKDTSLMVNGTEVGVLYENAGAHGFLINYPVKFGDELCAVNYSSYGYHIIVGPDIFYHYDSYCFRGNC